MRNCGFSLYYLGSLLLLALVGCAGAEQNRNKSDHKIDWPPNLSGEPANLVPTEVEPETVYIKNATIMTAAGETIQKGHLLMEGGQIKRVSAEPLEAPSGAKIIDGKGKYVTPGIIDTHSHMGVYPSPYAGAHSDGNEATNPTTPGVDAGDAVWPQDPALQRALAGGVVAIQILPGSANLMGGRTTVLELHPGISNQAMVFEEAPDGLKMACGENPKRVYGSRGQMPSTRMGNMAVLRSAFQKAKELKNKYQKYRRKVKEWQNKSKEKRGAKPSPPSRDFGKENLMTLMNPEMTEKPLLLHVHCYRADDIVKFVQLAEQFGFSIRSIHHGLEAYKVRDLLKKRNISVSTWADWWGYKLEMHDAIPHNAGLIETAGGRAVIHSDSSRGVQRLNQEAAKAYYAAKQQGLEITENEALRWITANAAWTLGIQDITGTLEVGKRADVVLWSEHPFSTYAKAEKVWVEGVREYDRSRDPKPWSDFEIGQSPKSKEVTP